ncbi:uncharacterized protein LOC108109662 [Drosophila eugracilis]|uniref:uncharacterized protein LOC108109662 n=1 Tax=Drosophila eugracilis TaxID=29029 RepID=UPI0007E7B292|nr:uncharacterized protein LOC108109662 [Drosophila eugracilis]
MDAKQQLPQQDVNQDRGELATSSKDLELDGHGEDLSWNTSLTTVCSSLPLTARSSKDLELDGRGEDLSRNNSLTTVCSRFPLTSRIESWQPMDSETAKETFINPKLEVKSELKVQQAVLVPHAIEPLQP